MASIRSRSWACLAATLLPGLAAGQDDRKAQSIVTPSIAATTLPVTGTVDGPAFSADINTSTTETSLGASVKATLERIGLKSLGVVLGVQSAQPGGGVGAVGAVSDTGGSISSGAQANLALTYSNYDLKPDEDPGVKAFEDAARKCGVRSANAFRSTVETLAKAKREKTLTAEQQELARRCTFDEGQAFWLVEGARSRPFLLSAGATLGRSSTVFLDTSTYEPTDDLVKLGASVAIGQYILSNAVIAASFGWSTGNVVSLYASPSNVCRQIDTDVSGNPVTECETGVIGTPRRGNLFKAALELRMLTLGGRVAINPGATLSWADQSPPRFRAQLPVLFQIIPTGDDDAKPLLVGLTVGYASAVAGTSLDHSFSVAGTLQTQFSLSKL